MRIRQCSTMGLIASQHLCSPVSSVFQRRTCNTARYRPGSAVLHQWLFNYSLDHVCFPAHVALVPSQLVIKQDQSGTYVDPNRPVRVLPMYGLCFLVTQWHIRHRLAEAELAGARNRLGISHVAVSDVRHRRLDRHTAACQHHLRLIGRRSLYSKRPCRIRPDSIVRLKKQVNSKNGVQLLRILLLFFCPHAVREI